MTNPENEIYMHNLMTRKVQLPFRIIGENIKENLHQKLQILEGKCINEGYVKSNSINIITYSSGIIKGNTVIFEVVFEALICRPVEGMKIKCVIKNITKAGIRAETDESVSPVVIFVARDHYYNNDYFTSRKEKDKITINVIGIRYELNDKYISIIADLYSSEDKQT